MKMLMAGALVASAVAVTGCSTFESTRSHNCYGYNSRGYADYQDRRYYSRECDRRYHHDGWGN